MRIALLKSPPSSKPIYPAGDPISLLIACFSAYSLISKRSKFKPKNSAKALQNSVFPTPLDPVNKNTPRGVLEFLNPAKLCLSDETRLSITSSWPKIFAFKFVFKFIKALF